MFSKISNSSVFSLEFQKVFFFRSLEHFFLRVGQNNFDNKIPFFFTETESGELKLPTDELLEQPSKLNKSKKFSLLRKSEETLIVNVKYSMIDLIPESLTTLLF